MESVLLVVVRGLMSWRAKHGITGAQTQTPNLVEVGRLTDRALAMTYFLTGNPQYHRRGVVSRSCSGWEGVGPTRYGRQEFWNSKVVLDCVLHRAGKHEQQGYRVKPHGQLVPVSSMG